MSFLSKRIEDDKDVKSGLYKCKYCGVPTGRLCVCEKHYRDEMELMRSKGWY